MTFREACEYIVANCPPRQPERTDLRPCTVDELMTRDPAEARTLTEIHKRMYDAGVDGRVGSEAIRAVADHWGIRLPPQYTADTKAT